VNLAQLSKVLGEATGITAVTVENRPGDWPSAVVRLDKAIGAKTTQRLSLQVRDDSLTLCTWPAELKLQAKSMYQVARVTRFLDFIESHMHSWTAFPNLHLAYRSAPTHKYLYLSQQFDIREYVSRWLGDDFAYVGAYDRDAAWKSLWPWLLEREYADAAYRTRFTNFLDSLGGHPVLLRPGIALEHRWLRMEEWEEWPGWERVRHGAAVSLVSHPIWQVLTALDEPLPPGCQRWTESKPSPAESKSRSAPVDEVPPEALEDVLIDRARWTHARMTAGSRHGVDLHEKTITQNLLLDISTALPALEVRTFTERQESRSGADWQWEWWFEGRHWFGLRVQAKRLKPLKSGRLGYDLSYKSGRNRQVDLLIDDAAQAGLPAAYVLYNGPGLDTAAFGWRCRRLPPKAAFFGVSLLPAPAALALVNAGRDDFATVASASAPWSCLASCGWSRCSPNRKSDPAASTGANADLSDWFSSSYQRIRQSAYDALRNLASDPALREEADFGVRLRDRPPGYVMNIRNGEASAGLRLPARVGAVTVFRTRSRQES